MKKDPLTFPKLRETNTRMTRNKTKGVFVNFAMSGLTYERTSYITSSHSMTHLRHLRVDSPANLNWKMRGNDSNAAFAPRFSHTGAIASVMFKVTEKRLIGAPVSNAMCAQKNIATVMISTYTTPYTPDKNNLFATFVAKDFGWTPSWKLI